MRGSRVQAVVNELQGEKIDIIPWTADPANFVVNALAPAEVAKVVLDEDRQRMEVVVPDQQLSLAIGRRGQNVRLASQLTGWDIDIVTEQEESEHRQAEFEKRTKLFIDALNLDEVVGQLLASEGFNSVEELAAVDEKEIAGIEGFDEETARELQTRAREHLAKEEAELDARRQALGVQDELKELAGVTTAMLVKLGEDGVKTMEDLAGCATDDLFGWSERKDGETVKHAGILGDFDLSPLALRKCAILNQIGPAAQRLLDGLAAAPAFDLSVVSAEKHLRCLHSAILSRPSEVRVIKQTGRKGFALGRLLTSKRPGDQPRS
jgi:N utilization substance protein A